MLLHELNELIRDARKNEESKREREENSNQIPCFVNKTTWIVQVVPYSPFHFSFLLRFIPNEKHYMTTDEKTRNQLQL